MRIEAAAAPAAACAAASRRCAGAVCWAAPCALLALRLTWAARLVSCLLLEQVSLRCALPGAALSPSLPPSARPSLAISLSVQTCWLPSPFTAAAGPGEGRGDCALAASSLSGRPHLSSRQQLRLPSRCALCSPTDCVCDLASRLEAAAAASSRRCLTRCDPLCDSAAARRTSAVVVSAPVPAAPRAAPGCQLQAGDCRQRENRLLSRVGQSVSASRSLTLSQMSAAAASSTADSGHCPGRNTRSATMPDAPHERGAECGSAVADSQTAEAHTLCRRQASACRGIPWIPLTSGCPLISRCQRAGETERKASPQQQPTHSRLSTTEPHAHPPTAAVQQATPCRRSQLMGSWSVNTRRSQPLTSVGRADWQREDGESERNAVVSTTEIEQPQSISSASSTVIFFCKPIWLALVISSRTHDICPPSACGITAAQTQRPIASVDR